MVLTTHGDSVILDLAMSIKDKFIRRGEALWEIPVSYKKGMRVPARIYATEKLLRDMKLLQIYEGTSQIQRVVIARRLLRD